MTAPDSATDELVIDNRDHSNSLLASFARLRERQILCDITLKVDEEAYPVHRALLSAASSFFEAMFTCGLAESTASEIELHVAPIPARVFGLFLDFLYTGRVSLGGGDQDLLPLLCVADEYGCQALTRCCLPLLSQVHFFRILLF
jgi:hypothetical protein